jgi:hypothetical protein
MEVHFQERAEFVAIVQVVGGLEIDPRFLDVGIEVGLAATTVAQRNRERNIVVASEALVGGVIIRIHHVQLDVTAKRVAVLVFCLGLGGLVLGHQGVEALFRGGRCCLDFFAARWLTRSHWSVQQLLDQGLELRHPRFQFLDAVPISEGSARGGRQGRCN